MIGDSSLDAISIFPLAYCLQGVFAPTCWIPPQNLQSWMGLRILLLDQLLFFWVFFIMPVVVGLMCSLQLQICNISDRKEMCGWIHSYCSCQVYLSCQCAPMPFYYHLVMFDNTICSIWVLALLSPVLLKASDLALQLPVAYWNEYFILWSHVILYFEFPCPLFGDFGLSWKNLYSNVAFLHISYKTLPSFGFANRATAFNVNSVRFVFPILPLLLDFSLFCILFCSWISLLCSWSCCLIAFLSLVLYCFGYFWSLNVTPRRLWSHKWKRHLKD